MKNKKNNMKNKEIGDLLAEETLRVSQMEMEEKKLTPSKMNKLFKEWASKNGCDECKHFLERTIICKSNCLFKFLKSLDNKDK